MDNRKQALTDMLDNIKLGTWPGADMHDMLGSDRRGELAYDAYNGSLNAAMALHEAVLPGCGRAVDATMPEAGICVDIHREAQAIGTGDNTCEARAWLIAIIEALIAERTV